jgi:hypothetical protein
VLGALGPSAYRVGARPPQGSAEEDVALHATFELMLTVGQALTAHPQAALRAYGNQGLRRVVREQRTAAEDDRMFALRQLEQALDHYGVAVETFAVLEDVFAQIWKRSRTWAFRRSRCRRNCVRSTAPTGLS